MPCTFRAQAVIAAERDRHRTLGERRQRRLKQTLADARDVLHVSLVRIAGALALGNRRRHVTLVDDAHAELGELLGEPRDAEGRWPHVGAAPVAAEIERHADDVNGFHLVIC
jgi:hypothetical protein